jgi:hypothetical protein
MLVRCKQAVARERKCLDKARRSGVCKAKGKRGGESNKTRARQGGMQLMEQGSVVWVEVQRTGETAS